MAGLCCLEKVDCVLPNGLPSVEDIKEKIQRVK
jgi:hypothetical protein